MDGVARELQDELNGLFERGVQLAGSARELQTKVEEQQSQLAATEQKVNDVSREIKDVEDRKAAILQTLVVRRVTQWPAARVSVSSSSAVVDLTQDEPIRETKPPSASAGDRSTAGPVALTPSNVGLPTVVKLDNEWTEVWCHICGTNVNYLGKYFLGISGLHAHIVYHDGAGKRKSGITTDDLLANCGRRVLSQEDMALIRAGQQPVVKIGERYATARRISALLPHEDGRPLNDCDMHELKAETKVEERRNAVHGRFGTKRFAEASEDELAGWTINRPKRASKTARVSRNAKAGSAGLEEDDGHIVFEGSASPAQVKDQREGPALVGQDA
ncbi:hypothetical protein B0A55_11017 [Friedmanniomyces simplex]|uniref:Uncharacterized protein n=1 Tax=Friedmanniomyces simplex TaxID=329884 RepID=A0A4U0WIH5_9PEZI|nr:hypothetical protein B0A55_11017 [Friedmanniomyces simplex]